MYISSTSLLYATGNWQNDSVLMIGATVWFSLEYKDHVPEGILLLFFSFDLFFMFSCRTKVFIFSFCLNVEV